MGTPILDDAVAELWLRDPGSVLALADVAQERLRQLTVEGWTVRHDDAFGSRELARAGACYAAEPRRALAPELAVSPPLGCPWFDKLWKPRSEHRNQVVGAALIVAEIARRYRRTGSFAYDAARGEVVFREGEGGGW